MFLIKLYDDEKIVGHLTMGITIPTKYLIDWCAVFGLGLTSTIAFQKDQEGLGIFAKVRCTVTMPVTNRIHMLIDKYKELVNEPYSETKKKRKLQAHFNFTINCNNKSLHRNKENKQNQMQK